MWKLSTNQMEATAEWSETRLDHTLEGKGKNSYENRNQI